MSKVMEQHTAAPIDVAFDYQFYYFVLKALNLVHGQKIGYEVKDDIHIETPNETILIQAKHSIQKKADGSIQNMTNSDVDLWKTLSNWIDFSKSVDYNDFINKHTFIFVTNKDDVNNDFIAQKSKSDDSGDFTELIDYIEKFKRNTENKALKDFCKNILSIGKRKLRKFFPKLKVEANSDDVIRKIREKIIEKNYQSDIVDSIFHSLTSNLNLSKYLEVKKGQKFELTFERFRKEFGKCFKVATEPKPLPKRRLPVLLPQNLEEQTFIKQLVDIGEIDEGSKDIREYTRHMLTYLDHLSYWFIEEHFLLSSEIDDFNKNSKLLWRNNFKSKFRQIKRQIDSGIRTIEDLEEEIKNAGIELVEFIKEQDLYFEGHSPLGLEFSNGHYYALSDSLEIGWHLDWENKYKSE